MRSPIAKTLQSIYFTSPIHFITLPGLHFSQFFGSRVICTSVKTIRERVGPETMTQRPKKSQRMYDDGDIVRTRKGSRSR